MQPRDGRAPAERGAPPLRAAPVPAWIPLGVAALLVVAAHLGDRSGWLPELSLGRTSPLIGQPDPRVGLRTLVAASVGVAAVALAPLAVERLRWHALLASAWVTSALWTVALAATDGREAVWAPLDTRFEYRAVLDDVERLGVGRFVDGFVADLPGYPVHVRGHPVGSPLAFWLPERLGLHGPGWSAAVVLVAGTSVVVTVGVVTRLLAGEAVARRAVPFLAIGPAAVWVGTSADALFAGTIALAACLLALAGARRGAARGSLGVLGGAVAAVALHLTYGAAVLLAPAAVVAVAATGDRTWRRRLAPLAWACVGAAAVTAGSVAAGFWWFDGLVATRAEYVRGAGGVRPWWWFAPIGNPASFGLALGPAVVVALARLRDARGWTVVGGALAAVVLADLSGMSKAEVERIWLPAVPFLAVAAACLPRWTWWLAAQAATALVIESLLSTPW